eukprot:1011338-Lingulodinium_polyedra.AAC.1
MEDDTVCEQVLCRMTGEVANLPAGFSVEYGDIGDQWRIEENYSLQHAYIHHVRSRKLQYLGPLFEKK